MNGKVSSATYQSFVHILLSHDYQNVIASHFRRNLIAEATQVQLFYLHVVSALQMPLLRVHGTRIWSVLCFRHLSINIDDERFKIMYDEYLKHQLRSISRKVCRQFSCGFLFVLFGLYYPFFLYSGDVLTFILQGPFADIQKSHISPPSQTTIL